jgi:hypothetical protein
MKSQATSLATMHGQLANIQQFCMTVNQLLPSCIYTPAQQQHTSNSRRSRRNGGGQSGGGFGGCNGYGGFPQQSKFVAFFLPVDIIQSNK